MVAIYAAIFAVHIILDLIAGAEIVGKLFYAILFIKAGCLETIGVTILHIQKP